MHHVGRLQLALWPLLLLSSAPPDDPSPDRKPAARLAMTPAVACESVEGYGQFVPLDDPTLTADDKLLVYYQPYNHTIEPSKDGYRVHLVQDARIRRRGQKPVLRTKEKVVDYEAQKPQPPVSLYLANTISLKGLGPGEYDLDIILHDALSGGPPAEQTLRFAIKAAVKPAGAEPREKLDQAAPPKARARTKGR